MTLRFQNKDDAVDRAAKEERATPVLIFMFVLCAAIEGASYWIRGESLANYAKDSAWVFMFVLAYWFLAPLYYEFRIRTKEIDGKVSELEERVAASAIEIYGKVSELEKHIDEKLDAIRRENSRRVE